MNFQLLLCLFSTNILKSNNIAIQINPVEALSCEKFALGVLLKCPAIDFGSSWDLNSQPSCD